MSADANLQLYGTAVAPDLLHPVRLGPLEFLYGADAIRRIRWHGTELVRAVAWPVRDANWGTHTPIILEQALQDDGAAFAAHLRFCVDDGRLDCALRIEASYAGDLQLDLTMTPIDGPFATNRAGFTVLHPIKGIAGAPLQVTHSNGADERTVFPRQISPGQPVFDISGLAYGLDGAAATIEFFGEVFEMEDQRNWSDASYKTYCVPLVAPFTYRIAAPRTQTIRIALAGEAPGADAQSAPAMTCRATDQTAPAIGLAVEPDWLADPAIVAQSGVGHIRARLGPDLPGAYLRQLASLSAQLEVELVIADHQDPAAALDAARGALAAAGLAPARIIALREGYLASHQPVGPWPEGPGPDDVVAATRAAFPGAEIGAGMLTHFTEFNRCRPDPALCDFVTYGSSAIVHAADDLSVCETLETLPQIFDSAQVIADGKPSRLGLMSIGMRSNPYGAAVADNPAQLRRTMAREDPRQRGLFAAAWAVGVLAATQGRDVAALCLGAPSGPFGIAGPDGRLHPIFHVVRAAAAMAGRKQLHLSGLPDGVHAYGAQTAAGTSVMIANASDRTRTVDPGLSGRAAILDATTFAKAAQQADWLQIAPRQEGERLILEPFSVAFLET